ncbi:hypothetical protein INN71_16150 [Nocardioides sp. ChNu-153]|uniref:hypothetical protein n=1 Tax=unclassified Nocardioides TaxID=2615069 RepID=UPI0024049DE9|nr:MULTISPECIES: hypothetical protein [unclassified Nocardioides]MDF9715924.1 hypothetical protein [Nocardioides sp. ChNu-99]MDN7122917.1 hypothetical protein [Nocardioides sp. ChNu-153]
MTEVVDRPRAPHAPAAPRPAVPPVPRPLLAVAALVVATTTVVAVLGAWQTGVSWDETYHVARMRSFLEHGWYLLEGDLDGDRPGAWEDQAYVYAPVTALLMHAAVVLAGLEGPGEVVATGEAYAVRHLVVVTIALVGTAAVALTARVLLRSWGWGLVAAAVLGSIPMWTGHAMFNVKDVPVATGCTLVTAGLVLLVTRARGAGTARYGVPAAVLLVLPAALLVLAGWVLALGTRPGIWPTLVASHVAAAVVLHPRLRSAAPLRSAPWVLATTPVAAWLVLLAVYPAVFATPLTTLWESAASSSRFDDARGEWFYVPALLVGEVPLLLLVLVLAGSVVALRRVLTGLRLPAGDTATSAWLLVGVQAWTLPLLAVVRESNLYNGLRQLLFMVPAMALLATLAVAALVGWAARAREAAQTAAPARPSRVRPRVLPGALLALVVVGLVAPTLDQLRLHPYGYTFATLPSYGVAQAADSDYWRTSVRELAPSVPAGWVTCSPALDEERRSLRRSLDGDENCAVDLIGPLSAYADVRGTDPVAGPALGPTEFWAVTAGPRRPGTNCTEVARVDRPGPLPGVGTLLGLPERDVMNRLARCELVLPDHDGSFLTFGPGGDGGDLELGGWTAHTAQPGIRLDGERAEVGFTLPGTGERVLRVGLTDAAGIRVLVNGTELDARVEGGALVATVPGSVLAAYGEGRVVVALEREGGADGYADDGGGDDRPRLLTMELTGGAGGAGGDG